jgi:competence protein ComEC
LSFPVEILSSEDGLRRKLYAFKHSLIRKVESNLSEPYASLGTGLLLGVKKGFSEEIMNMLKITGLTHIVAVSGYNVSLVILCVERLLFFIPRNIRFYVVFVFIVIFAIITGLSASVVRACIMGVISIVAIQFGYSNNLLRAMLLAAIGMILYNPAILYYDLGFQLSFFATIGVVYFSQFLKFEFVTNNFALRESLILTVAAQITTLPTILYYFGIISYVSAPANMIVAPILPLIMLGTVLILVLGQVWIVGDLIRLVLSFIAELFFLILSFFSSFKFAYSEFGIHNFKLILVVYVLIIVLLVKFLFFSKSD